MSFFAAAGARALDAGSAFAGIFGSISITAWICLLIPQLLSNYRTQSAEGLSMAFLFVWLLGDATNFAGALLTGLVPTATALAGYFVVADVVLIGQSMYYNRQAARRREAGQGTISEEAPLLSHDNHSAAAKAAAAAEDRSQMQPWVQNSVSLAGVYIVGALGWFASYKLGAMSSDPTNPEVPSTSVTGETVGIWLGYFSAVCYLCARIPQIIKNYRQKSCEGLALLFFLLSLTGNFTYTVSLLAYSQEPAYLIKVTPWLLGSAGTMVEDCIIFVQFRLYSKPQPTVTVTPP